MKIEELYIYGYGQLEDVHIKGLADFQVFYGENEAGKSTIMAFIHGILFGFPTKQQTELRYEPKTNTKYGGKIKITHPEMGGAVIERVKGKASGDVKVVLDNGAIGGEELLKELLFKFDKHLFQAIFSFNLLGLQNVHHIKGDDIGKFLFSAGALGTERLSKAETLLQKELDYRFKPSGKKPLLNEKLQELHEVSLQLKKADAKTKEYENFIMKRQNLQQEMAEIHDRIHDLQNQVEKLMEWKRIEPIVKEEYWTKKELEDIGEISFPARGIERLERLSQLIHPHHAEMASMAERMDQIKKEMLELEPNVELLENEPAILALLDQVPLFEQLKLELQQSEAKLADLKEKLSVIQEKLHLEITEEDLMTINTNIYMKNQVEMISRKSKRLNEIKEELEERYQKEKKKLEDLENSVQSAESLCLPVQERMDLEELVNQENSKNNLEIEFKSVQDKINLYLHTARHEKAGKQRIKLQFVIFDVVLAALAIYGLITNQWFLFFIGATGFVAASLLIVKNIKQTSENDFEQTLNHLREQEKQIKEKLHGLENKDITRIKEQLQLDSQRHEQLKVLKMQLKQQEVQFEGVIAKFEQWEMDSSNHKEKLKSLTKELKIPYQIAQSFLLEAFQLLEQYKAIVREQSQMKLRVKQIKVQMSQTEEGLQLLEDQYLSEKGGELHKTAFLLRKRLQEEREKQIKKQEKQKQLINLKDDLVQKSQEYETLLAERNELFSEADTETEQQFYDLGNRSEIQAKLLERWKSLKSQLHFTLLSESERENYLNELPSPELIERDNREIQILQTKLNLHQEEQAAIGYEIQVLEEGGIYSDILHHYKQKKFELEESVKQWAVYSLAVDILSSTIERYKNVHLPKMLAKAEEYLTFLTNGNYQRIHLHASGTGFLVERNDRTIFEANELSQATTEQLYVAIRLALATTLYENYHFPIIIDDSFVNFDFQRTKKVINLLKSLENNQVLFFTCHSHLLSLFQKEQILNLEKGAVLDYFIEL
ncbi:AAA family ATPase [Bacillus sp. BRMEA1]|uniref:ATP-binding protein n=1 Tax=Neobacillus endophyticus TaxID=2738405 RepID=UPI0015669E3D|nr:AAA family ATPase [Neobacillus endophyticus]NRD78354.1 AAA family ATPase [Neobacillus endophyticus]